jgi:NADPH:quinone reductase-like Zn-dependent oxidoreductase
VTFVIRNSGGASLPRLQSLHYTRADDASKGDAISSEPVERERYSKAPTYPDLTGNVVVVTGGSGGIGAATCWLLAANGVKVAINGRDEAKIGDSVDAIRSAGGEALGVAADCTDLG